MEQRESAQNLEQRVDDLEKRSDDAISSGQKRFIVGLAGGAFSALMVSLAAYSEQSPLVKTLYTTIGGLSGINSLMIGVQSVLDFYRSDLLKDKIAELKQLPDYKVREGPEQNS